MKAGILAVQGAFAEHGHTLDALKADYVFIRNAADISDDITHLILPGGESTVQRKLIKELEMYDRLKSMIDGGIPVFGTCAGLILLAEEISGGEEPCFSAIPVSVRRNGYGRQLGSFSAHGDVGDIKDFDMRFIRAPYIESAAPEAEILNVTDGRITAVKYKNRIGVAFHPELTPDYRIHEAFLNMNA